MFEIFHFRLEHGAPVVWADKSTLALGLVVYLLGADVTAHSGFCLQPFPVGQIQSNFIGGKERQGRDAGEWHLLGRILGKMENLLSLFLYRSYTPLFIVCFFPLLFLHTSSSHTCH